MGFFGSLVFQRQFLDNLLWSLFAVGYPLLASVKALMENKPINDLRKLVAYWIIFFFFSLFELVLAKFIQWIPFWPCITLGTVCWLVLPQFEQAYFVYSHHIQPILLLIYNYFSKSVKRIVFNKEMFLVMGEKFVEVKGSEAFKDAIATKDTHDALIEKQQPSLLLEYRNHAEKVIEKVVEKVVERTGKSVNQIAKPPGCCICDICDVKMFSVGSYNSHVYGKRHQKALGAYKDERFTISFTCSLCDVPCSSIASIQSHLKGRKHLNSVSKLFVESDGLT